MNQEIVLIRPHDTWVSVALTNWCSDIGDTPAQMKVSAVGCHKIDVTCAPGPCGQNIRTYTEVPVPSITLVSDGSVCGGLRFQITPELRALGTGRFNAEVTACGKTATLGLQVVDNLRVESTKTGYTFTTIPYTVDNVVVGELAVFNNCALPRGWVAVRDTAGVVLGYARQTSSMGFCKKYTLTTCPPRVVYLK